MKVPPLLAHVAVYVGMALVAAYASAADGSTTPELKPHATLSPDSPRYRELTHMVRQDCGSCHGLTLAGGLGPALTPQALADVPAEVLVATIVGGRPGTPMPPFRGILSEAEAQWIVEQLLQGFPPDTGLAR